MEYKELYQEIEHVMDLHDNGTITRAGDVDISVKETVDKIGRFIQSKYLKMKDPRTGKVKRFKNIGNAIVDMEFRAKNIDRKSIEYQATDGDFVFSMIINAHLQNWMKNNNFGLTIDEYQYKKTQYGSVTLKDSIERDEDNKKKLAIDVVQYSYAYFNARDMDGGIFIEKSEMSPMELRKKTDVWDKDAVEKAIKLHKKEKADGKDIEILDIDGEFPVHFFEDVEEEDDYQTKYYNVICAKIHEEKIILDYNEIDRSRYMTDARKKVDGCDFGIGVWEEVFEPQQAINHSLIEEENAMDIAGKTIIKTNKQDVPNALNMVNGEMIYLERDEYMESMSLVPSALPMHQAMVDNWFLNMQRDQSAFAGMTGEQPKASTPFSSLALQASQGGSIFNKRRDQDGFFLSKYIFTVVLPFIIKGINKEHTLTASFSPTELKMIDDAFRTEKMNKSALGGILGGMELPPELMVQMGMEVDKQIEKAKDVRSIEVPKGYITMKRIKDKGMIDITGEMSDSQRELNSLATTLQGLPPEDPARRTIIEQMSEITGQSPVTLGMGQPTENTRPVTQTQNSITKALPQAQQ